MSKKKKKKGPAQMVTYAVRMQHAKNILADEERKALVHYCLTTIYQAAAVALNDEFGFGAKRVERFRDKLNKTMLEFGVLQDDADTDYAAGALERRYKQITGNNQEVTNEELC